MKSLEELAAIRAKMLEQVSLRKGDNIDTRIVVGMATCGIAAGAGSRMRRFPRPAAWASAVWNRLSRSMSRVRRR